MSRALTVAEVLALPAAVDLTTAGRALGIGRTTAYDMAKRGVYPLPLLKIGAQHRVRRADILAFLGIDDLATASHATA